MSATLVSSNTTIKVNGAVSVSGTASGGTLTLYTAPSNGYAIVQVSWSVATGSNMRILVGSRIVYYVNESNHPANNGTTIGQGMSALTLYIGPSQTLQISESAGSGSISAVASGVEFVNTP